jgi:hypothetical protein
MIGFIGTSLRLQSILTAEASLHSAPSYTTACKRPSLSPINLRHGPPTENTLETPYPSNSSIVIETAFLLLLPALRRGCV